MFHQWMKTYAGEDRDWCEVMDDGDAGEKGETDEVGGKDYWNWNWKGNWNWKLNNNNNNNNWKSTRPLDKDSGEENVDKGGDGELY